MLATRNSCSKILKCMPMLLFRSSLSCHRNRLLSLSVSLHFDSFVVLKDVKVISVQCSFLCIQFPSRLGLGNKGCGQIKFDTQSQNFQVVEAKESLSVTLALARAKSVRHCSGKAGEKIEGADEAKTSSGSQTWRLQWFSEDGVFKFVTLVKAIHAGVNMSPLPIRCIS